MKRRSFIISTSLAVIGLPVAYYFKKLQSQPDPLYTPEILSHFCDEKILRTIGIKYRNSVTKENEKQLLIDLILKDVNGKKINSSNKLLVNKLINKKIKEDFTASEIVVINGWVISKTEARQCALLSLNKI